MSHDCLVRTSGADELPAAKSTSASEGGQNELCKRFLRVMGGTIGTQIDIWGQEPGLWMMIVVYQVFGIVAIRVREQVTVLSLFRSIHVYYLLTNQ